MFIIRNSKFTLYPCFHSLLYPILPLSSRHSSITVVSCWSSQRVHWQGRYWEGEERWWSSPCKHEHHLDGNQGFSANHSEQTLLRHISRPDRFLIQTATWKQNTAQTQLSFHSVVSFSCISMSISSFLWWQLLSSLNYDPHQRTAAMAQMISKNPPTALDAFLSFLGPPCSSISISFSEKKKKSKPLLPFILKS